MKSLHLVCDLRPYLSLYDADWIRFFLRTVTPNNDLLPPKAAAKLKSLPVLKAFILWVLVRDPDRRPKISDLKVKFAVVRRELGGGLAPVLDDNAAAASARCAGGLWAIGDGVGGTPLGMRWPASPTAPRPISLSTFFPASTTPSGLKCAALEMSPVCVTRRWRLSPGMMAPSFISSSGLDAVCFSDVEAMLSAPLHASDIVAIIICTHRLAGFGEHLLGRSTAKRLTERAECRLDLIARFVRVAAAAGIETLVTSLPCVTAHGGGAQTQFSTAMSSTAKFARRALFLAGTGRTVGVAVGEAVTNGRRGRVLLVSMQDDATAALAVAASIHMCVYDGGIRAATSALSPAATLEAHLPTLHPADVARLSAWEARVRADAAPLREKPWIRCPKGCWSVALKAPLSSSAHPTQRNPHPCSGMRDARCAHGCPGLHLGIADACATIRESLSPHAARREEDTATAVLWWAYTTAEALEPGVLCAVALAEEHGVTAHDSGTSVGEGGSAIGGLTRRSLDTVPIRDGVGAWQLYVCGACRCATHAVAKGDCGPTRRVAVIVGPNSSGILECARQS